MSDWLTMTRRRCLTLLAGSLAVVSTSWPGSLWSAKGERARDAEAAHWRRQLRSPESAVVVGNAYLAAVPQGESELMDALAAAVGRADVGVLGLSDGELGRRLRVAIRSDYLFNAGFSPGFSLGFSPGMNSESNRTVRLEGWTLSRTEAQLCAIYALGEANA